MIIASFSSPALHTVIPGRREKDLCWWEHSPPFELRKPRRNAKEEGRFLNEG
jgi:hypothetical protein